ncbi:MAG: hypothetical protein CME60_06025 [Halobacteriovoraceae bacterium]|nr:hypothetical protein [Halobacteriovoraceae bacterium]
MENTQQKNQVHRPSLFLKGSIFFDPNGKEVLKDRMGKTYLMDNQVKSHWRSVERILSKPGHSIFTLDELVEKIPKQHKNEQTTRILKKFLELDLIGLA